MAGDADHLIHEGSAKLGLRSSIAENTVEPELFGGVFGVVEDSHTGGLLIDDDVCIDGHLPSLRSFSCRGRTLQMTSNLRSRSSAPMRARRMVLGVDGSIVDYLN